LSRAFLQEQKFTEATAALDQAGTYRDQHVLEREPSPYVGENRCTPCHRAIAEACEKSRHARSYYGAAGLAALPLPDQPLPDPGYPKVTHTLRRDGEKVVVETRAPEGVYRALVEYAFGTTDRYVTMVSRDDDAERRYRAVRLSYHHSPKGSGWDISAGDLLHPGHVPPFLGRPIDVRDGVVRCLFCHTTNPRGGNVRTGPETGDHGIGCERCHGPGENHLAAVKGHFRELAIMNPAKGTAREVTTMCSECHVLNLPELELTVPRDDLLWVRSPGTGLSWSRCATESEDGLNCLTCHDPHRPVQTSLSHYEASCLGCHPATRGATSPDRSDTGVRSDEKNRVCSVNPSKDCVRCHMPKVYNPTLHMALTDHYIRKRPPVANLPANPNP
jgi:hypothetical protein